MPLHGVLPLAADTMAEVATLYEAYSSRVYGFFCLRTGGGQVAEDLTQITFEKVVRRYHTYAPEKGGIETWLFTVARNVLRDYYKSPARKPTQSLDDPATGLQPASRPDMVQQSEQRETIATGLAALNKRERLAVALKYGAGLPNTAVARVLGVKDKNAGVILHRALKKMAAAIQKEAGENA